MRGSARRLYLLLHAVRQRAVEAEDGGRQAARALGPEAGRVLRSTAPQHRAAETKSTHRYEISFQVAYIAGVRERVGGDASGYLTLSRGALRRVLAANPPEREAGSN